MLVPQQQSEIYGSKLYIQKYRSQNSTFRENIGGQNSTFRENIGVKTLHSEKI